MTIALAILLLGVGVGMIVLEVLIPSFGLFTLISVGCMFGSIAIAFGESTNLGIAFLVCAVVLGPAAIAFGFHVLNNTRFGDRLLLRAPDTAAAVGAIYADNERLSGRRGIAVTPLRPAGTADFDGERIPVVTEGELIDAQTPIEVVFVEGNRIVVHAVAPGSPPDERTAL